jgi:hypothetical protein
VAVAKDYRGMVKHENRRSPWCQNADVRDQRKRCDLEINRETEARRTSHLSQGPAVAAEKCRQNLTRRSGSRQRSGGAKDHGIISGTALVIDGERNMAGGTNLQSRGKVALGIADMIVLERDGVIVQ